MLSTTEQDDYSPIRYAGRDPFYMVSIEVDDGLETGASDANSMRETLFHSVPVSSTYSDLGYGKMPSSRSRRSSSHYSDYRPQSTERLPPRTRSTTSIPQSRPKIQQIPFLTWRVSWDADRRTEAQIDQMIDGILNKSDAILTSGSIRSIYVPSYKASEEDVHRRLQAFNTTISYTSSEDTETKTTSSTSINDTIKGNESTEHHTQRTNIATTNPEALEDVVEQETKRPKTQEHPEISQVPRDSSFLGEFLDDDLSDYNSMSSDIENYKAMLSSLLEVSQKVLEAFLPRRANFSTHPLTSRIWGAVDLIFRVLIAYVGRSLKTFTNDYTSNCI